MNLKWLKQHSLTAALVAAFVVVLGVLIWLQQKAASKRAEVDAALLEQQSQYEHLNQQKVAPSRENIDSVKRDREQLDHLYGQLLGVVSHNIEVPADLRPVDFLQLYASSIARLHHVAEAWGVKVPEGFAFGFGRYVGTLPAKNLSADDTKRVLVLLVKQLTTIDHVSQLLMSNHVAEIDAIRRAEVEPGGGAAGGSDALDAGVKTEANALYQVLPFEFDFKCTGDSLRNFLNSLTKADLFLAVRRLQITGESPTTEKSSTGPGPAAPIGVAPTGPNPSLLAVTVRIDLIEFSPPPPPPPPQPAKKAAGKSRA
jgi:hypothetical protein